LGAYSVFVSLVSFFGKKLNGAEPEDVDAPNDGVDDTAEALDASGALPN